MATAKWPISLTHCQALAVPLRQVPGTSPICSSSFVLLYGFDHNRQIGVVRNRLGQEKVLAEGEKSVKDLNVYDNHDGLDFSALPGTPVRGGRTRDSRRGPRGWTVRTVASTDRIRRRRGRIHTGPSLQPPGKEWPKSKEIPTDRHGNRPIFGDDRQLVICGSHPCGIQRWPGARRPFRPYDR
jgi:hypothetical protein